MNFGSDLTSRSVRGSDRLKSLPEHSSTSSHPALRLTGLLLVLAGLFGMHGLAGHAAASMSMQTALPATLPGAMSAASMSMDVSDVVTAPTAIVSDAVQLGGEPAADLLEVVTGSGHGGMAMGALCLAILGAALLALLRLLRQTPTASVSRLLPQHARAIAARGRDPDPPSLIALSIQRC